jgi:tetratricopeptide (TPR) repeat protein
MKIIIIILLLVISFFSELFSQPCNKIWENSKITTDSKQQLDLLIKYIDSGCTDSIAEAYMNRAKIWCKLGNISFANIDFRNAVEINPNLSEGWYQLAHFAYWDYNSDSISIIFINRAIKPNTQNWRYYMLRGDILGARHSFKSALDDYEKSIELIKNSKSSDDNDLELNYQAIGGTLIDMSQSETNEALKTNLLTKAIENLHQAIKLDSLFAKAYFLLGNAFYYQKNYEESINAYESSLKIDPNQPSIFNNLAIVYRQRGKYFGEEKHDLSEAIASLEKSYQLNPKDTETLRLLGVANGMNEEHEKALNWFIKASELDPTNASVWWDMSVAHESLGNKKEMKKCRKIALRIDPDIGKK